VSENRRYASPAALERAISDLLAGRFPKEELQPRRNEIAYRRLVARMYAADPGKWILKGGFAMILRLDPNRTSNDIDVTYVHHAGEHALALEALKRATALDLDDYFSFEVLRVGDETEDRARRVTVLCRLGAREFARFRVDLAVPEPDVPAEQAEAPPLTGVDEIDAVPPLLVLAWPQQIAEKICAMFEEHADGFSSRARDLADLGMVASQVEGLEGSALIEAMRSEEAKRRSRSLPHGLPSALVLREDQARQWRGNFAKATRGAPISFDEALDRSARLVNPLLEGSAAGRKWDKDSQAYVRA
jgi:Nucleotidyl transferase AbiEii toxin, Type IV TA system